ncbi:ubiquitin carboxyl-terminal hydrolase 12-like protein isoform X1, partial [Tanacetum coccineum]
MLKLTYKETLLYGEAMHQLVEYLAERMIYGVTLQRNSVMRRSYANQVGRLFVKGTGMPTETLAKLNELVGFAPDEDIELFEIKFEPNVMCEHVDKKLTFRASQLEDGYIICLQKPLQPGTAKCPYPNVPFFLEYVHNRQSHSAYSSISMNRLCAFARWRNPRRMSSSWNCQNSTTMMMLLKDLHDLSLDDPSKIRLTSHNCRPQQDQTSATWKFVNSVST